ncbi:MAG: hypothetical protein COB65_02860 [Thalassobium sp.]|nr:MAG: hypothetical protein COB65_02860 [Thalassobium sp.]
MNTLWGAWISIRSKALHSKNPKTSSDARRIDQNPFGALRSLQEDLRHGRFEFEPQKGVLSPREGKAPRPLVISPVRNRIVQRAILDTIQNEKPSIRRRLGLIPTVLETETSVGGLPGRGSPDAVRLIRAAIADGANSFVRSDIKDFFTRVQTAALIKDIRETTGDDEFAALIEAGLRVELANADRPDIKEWYRLFPDGTTGVPQGSSLSAFCANYVLKRLDDELNQGAVTMVRYIDDFVILGSDEATVDDSWATARKILDTANLEVHEPTPGGSKASLGNVQDGFEFLSYRFHGKQVGLSKAAKRSLLKSVADAAARTKRNISGQTQKQRRAEHRLAQGLVDIDRLVRGWGDSFRDVDQRLEFKQLDQKISGHVRDLLGWYSSQIKGMEADQRSRALGVALLYDTPDRDLSDDQE